MINENNLQVSTSRISTLIKAIGIHPGEGLPTALLFGQAFGLGVALYTMFTAANAIFLDEFGAEAIPYVYIVAAIINALIGVGFTWLERYFSFAQLLVTTLIFLALSTLILRLGLTAVGPAGQIGLAGLLIFALPVWLRLMWVLGNLVIWALAGRLFDVRQSKRLFTLIMAGAVFGIILSGLILTPIILIIGTSNLLFITVACLAAVLGLLLLTISKFRSQLDKAEASTVNTAAQPKAQWRYFLSNRYILLIFIYTVLSTLGTYVLDFAFFAETRSNISDLDELARFLGNYIGITTLVMLVVSVAAGPIISRYGVKFGLWANPTFVAVGVILVILTLVTLGPIGLMFWLVVFTKGSDDVLVSATTNTSVRILYQPLPTHQQVPLQTAVESIISPLSMGLAGVLLLIFRALGIFDTLPIIIALFIILIGWVSVSLLLSQEYGTALKQALTARRFSDEETPRLFDRSSLEVIDQALSSDRAEMAIYVLNLMEEAHFDTFSKFLPRLLNHPRAEVRLAGLQFIERHRLIDTSPLIETMIEAESNRRVRGRALRTLASLIGPKFIPTANAHLQTTDAIIQQEVMVGLLRYAGLEGVLSAGETLLRWIDSPDPNQRSLAAKVLGETQLETYFHPLEKLLDDEDISVQQAALQAAGQLKNPTLWPQVASALSSDKVGEQAVKALMQGGPTTIPILTELFDDPNTTDKTRLSIAQIAGHIQTPESTNFLKQHLAFPHHDVRTKILFALSSHHYQADIATIPYIQAQLKSEADRASWLLATIVDLNESETVAPLMTPIQEALQNDLFQIRNRIFYLLSFRYESDTILQTQIYLTTSSEKRAYALEVLDVLLDRETKQMALPLISDTLTAKQQLDRLATLFPQPTLDHIHRLKAILEVPELELGRWVRAYALYLIGVLQLNTLSETVTTFLVTTNDPLLREGAVQTLKQLDADFADKMLATLPETVSAETVSAIENHQGQTTMLSTVERVLFLKSADIFNELSGEALIWVAQVAQEIHFSANERFIQQGDPGDGLFIIVTGTVEVVLDGGKTIDVQGEKSAIGEMALFSQRSRMANCIAQTEVTALKISQEDFQALLAQNSELALGIIKILAERLEDARLGTI